ncbi:MAG: hypothetical protein CMJ64_27765 [Planctomycetaceae bacterium]|nr:hypothetical protein [Planctomycetaceae bacterium]
MRTLVIVLIVGLSVSQADDRVPKQDRSRTLVQETVKANTGRRDESPTPRLDQAVKSIREQVAWFGERPKRYSREFLAAVATMNYVQSRVSPLNYSLLAKAEKPLPSNAEEYLASQAGICGGQVMTFREILDRLDVRNRPVEFYMRGSTRAENHSHIGAEVFYADKWHFFDITWGTYYRSEEPSKCIDNVLSISEVLATKDAKSLAVTNRSDLWFQQWTANSLNPFEYLTAKQMDLIVGRSGVVTLRPTDDEQLGQVYIATNQPNYIGRNNRSPDFGSLSVRLSGIKPNVVRCTVAVNGVAGSGKLVIRGQTGEVSRPLSVLKTGEHQFDLTKLDIDGELQLAVNSDNGREIGYVVFKQIVVTTDARH